MSGIATKTHRIVICYKTTETKILDTRKTTPGLTIFRKMGSKDRGRRKPPNWLI